MLSDISSYSIFLPALIALIRFKEIQTKYRPFLFLIWIGTINEVISNILIWKGHYTILNNDIYYLVEALMLTWFFMKVNRNALRWKWFVGLMVLFIIVWTLNLIFKKRDTEPVFYFSIIYSFCIVVMSISTVNYLLVADPTPLHRQPLFWISSGFILYFTLGIIVHAFWLFGLNRSMKFLSQVADILEWINLFINLVYAYAFLWIPKKQPSLLHY